MNGISSISNIPDAAQSAQLGIARGIAGLNEDAQVVAQSLTGLARSDQMLGTLIDVMA
jgi:hypothetical protein